MRRRALLVTVVASVLSIYTTSSFIAAMGYSESIKELAETEIVNTIALNNPIQDPVIKSKAMLDETGIVVNTLQIAKADIETKENMEFQLAIAKEEKVETELAIQLLREQEKEREEAELAKALAERSKQFELNNLVSYSVSPYYDEDGKLVVKDEKQAKSLDIRVPCNWDYEDFKVAIKPSLYPLIPVVMQIEDETGINALYLISSAAAETGWGTQFAGKNNYFNWSTNGINYYDFETLEEFTEYSSDRYGKSYCDPDFYVPFIDGNTKPDVITPSVVNMAYAKYKDGSINWRWSKEICAIMAGISQGRLENRCIYLSNNSQIMA